MLRAVILCAILSIALPSAMAQDFPDIPDSFSTTLEINFPLTNFTAEMVEHFDYDKNFIHIGMTAKSFSFDEWIFEDKKTTYLAMNLTAGSSPRCLSMPTGSGPGSIEHSAIDPSTNHIRHTKDMFKVGIVGTPAYQGKTTVRGITSDYWTAQISDTNKVRTGETAQITGTGTYYFAVAGWRDLEGNSRRPVRMTFKGTIKMGNLTRQEEVWYEFNDFKPGAPPASSMSLPLLCQAASGGTGAVKPLPALPKDFSTTIEANIIEKGYSLEIREVYDYTNSRLRFDHHKDGKSITELWFLDQSTHYSYSSDGECNKTEISSDGRLIGRDGKLRNTAELFQLTSATNHTYLGVTNARGIPCNTWLSTYKGPFPPPAPGTTVKSPVTIDYSLVWYFAEPKWNVRGEDDTHEMPIRAELKGSMNARGKITDFHHLYEFIDFHVRERGDSEFNPPRSCPDASSFIKGVDGETEGGKDGGGSSGKVATAVILTLIFGGGAAAAAGFFISKWHTRRQSGGNFEAVSAPPNLQAGAGGSVQQPPPHGGVISTQA